MKGTFFCTAILFVCASAVGGTFRHDRSNIQHIELAQDTRYQSVGRLNWNEFGSFFTGSGVLISPEWVLTAGHVAGGVDNAGGGITDFKFTIGGAEIPAAEWVAHHAWTATGGAEALFDGWDLGLVRLSRPVANILPATLYQGSDELGQVGTIVGYGQSGTGETGAFTPEGIRRAGNNVIDAIGTLQTPGGDLEFNYTHDRLLSTDFDNPLMPSDSRLGSSVPLDLEYDTAEGDSGGGLFIDVDGETFVAGITSLGRGNDADPINSDYGDVSSFVRVSLFIDWIEDETGLTFTTPVVEDVLGDFDGDGLVTSGDYDRWLSEFGRTSGVLTADANGDGIVNTADYGVWRTALAAAGSPAAAAAVPEPAAWALLASAATLAAGRRRRR